MKILYSSKISVSRKIAETLLDYEELLLDLAVDDMTSFKPVDDFQIVLSPHMSKSGRECITAHFPGLWEFGLSKSWAEAAFLFIYALWNRNLPLTLEVDHHTPISEYPIIFVEIGSDEKAWSNDRYIAAVSKGVRAIIEKEFTGPSYFGITGLHYAERLTRKMVEKGFTYTHLMAKYSFSYLTEERLIEAVEKSTLPADGILAEKKALKREQREKLKEMCRSLGLKLVFI